MRAERSTEGPRTSTRRKWQLPSKLLGVSFSVDVEPSGIDDWDLKLRDAYIQKNYELCEKLIQKVDDVNQIDDNKSTILHFVAKKYAQHEHRINIIPLLLLEKGADINAKDKNLNTPLHIAAREGLYELCNNFLLYRRKGMIEVRVDERNEHNMTPLHLAAKGGHTKLVELLLDSGADPCLRSRWKQMPLHFAAEGGHAETCRVLALYYPDTRDEPEPATPIMLAARNGHYHCLKQMVCIKDRINLHYKDSNGYTALHAAAKRGFESALWILLEMGIQPDERDKRDITALMLSVKRKKIKCIEHLQKAGAKFSLTDKEHKNVLHYAAMFNAEECMNHLLQDSELKERVDEKDHKQKTALAIAIEHQHYECAELLLSYNASPTVRVDETNNSLLHLAARNQNLDILKQLVNYKNIDVKLRNTENCTPLHEAAKSGSKDACLLLIRRGANVNAVDFHGRTALYCSSERGHPEVLRLLLSNKASTCIVEDDNKWTALHVAAGNGHLECCQVLVHDDKTLLYRLDKKDMYAINHAFRNGHDDVIQHLLKNTSCKNKAHLEASLQEDIHKYSHKSIKNQKINSLQTIIESDWWEKAFISGKKHAREDHISKNVIKGQDGKPREGPGTKKPKSHRTPKEEKDGLTELHQKQPKSTKSSTGKSDPVVDEEQGIVPVELPKKLKSHRTPKSNQVEEIPLTELGQKKPKLTRSTKSIEIEDRERKIPLSETREIQSESPRPTKYQVEEEVEDITLFSLQEDVKQKKPTSTKNLTSDQQSPKPSCSPKLEQSPRLHHIHIREQSLRSFDNLIVDESPNTKRNPKAYQHPKSSSKSQRNSKANTKTDSSPKLTNIDPKSNKNLKATHNLLPCPNFRNLIKWYPALATKVMDKCITKPRGTSNLGQCDFRIFEDNYYMKTGLSPFDKTSHRLDPEASELAGDGLAWKLDHPVSLILQHRRQSLLGHPLVQAWLDYKWDTYARKIFYATLVLQIFSVIVLTRFMLTVKNWGHINKNYTMSQAEYCNTRTTTTTTTTIPSPSTNSSTTTATTSSAHNVTGPDLSVLTNTPAVHVLHALVLISVVLQCLVEINNFYRLRLQYVDKTWLFLRFPCLVLTIVVLMPDSLCGFLYGIKAVLVWQCGVVALVLAWLLFIHIVNQLPQFSILAVVTWDFMVNFMKGVIVIIMYMYMFALVFYVLMEPAPGFKSPRKALMKMLVWLVGDYAYDDNFHDNLDYPILANVLFLVFICTFGALFVQLIKSPSSDESKLEYFKKVRMANILLNIDVCLPWSSIKRKHVIARLIMHKKKSQIFVHLRQCFVHLFKRSEYSSEPETPQKGDNLEGFTDEVDDGVKIKTLLEEQAKNTNEILTHAKQLIEAFQKLHEDMQKHQIKSYKSVHHEGVQTSEFEQTQEKSTE